MGAAVMTPSQLVRDLVTSDPEMQKLELLVDHYSLANILEGLVRIAHDKAEHLRSTWQDERAAKGWEADARTIDRIIAKIRNAG